MTNASDTLVADDVSPTSPPAPEEQLGRPPAVSSGAPTLAAALAAAQGEIVNPAKGAENPHFKSKYANLVEGLRAIKKPLAKQGIAVVQRTRIKDDLLILITSLLHESGEWIDSEWPVANWTKLTPQQMGSALTYARRYSLFSLVGISGADDDDDGQAASVLKVDPDAAEPLTADEIAYVEQLLRDTESNSQLFLSTMGASSVASMTLAQYKKGIALLNEKKRRAAGGTGQH